MDILFIDVVMMAVFGGLLWEMGRFFIYDNRWIVSYNPYLTRWFEDHVIFKVCAIVKAVKDTSIYEGGAVAALQFAI